MKVAPTVFYHPLHRRVAKTIRARALLLPGQTILVAVSGGADSVALLSILHALAPVWELSLRVVHCNYGLRGAESDGDADFVTTLCRRLGIPCVVTSVAVAQREVGASSSLQVRAREARYRLFRELAGRHGAARVALGHNADDQAETVLLRMLRGAGLRGLSGIPHIRERLFIRPLLAVSRQEILSYLGAAGLSYRVDSSNAKSAYLRNRVRHELLPVITSLAPGAVRMLARQADIIRDDDRLLDALSARRLRRVVQLSNETTVILGRSALCEQPVALQRRILRQALGLMSSSFGVPRGDQITSLLTSLTSPRSGGVWKIGKVEILSEPKQIRLTTASSRPTGRVVEDQSENGTIGSSFQEVTISSLPYTASWPMTGESIRIRTVTCDRGRVLLNNTSPLVALFDAEQLALPLRIRTWRRGDWFCPTGMNGRRKKLQDYFTDAKLGRSVRERMPLVLSRDCIAWIVGQRVDARFAATTSTTRFIVARVRQPLRRKGTF